jgi:hypothetical protein
MNIASLIIIALASSALAGKARVSFAEDVDEIRPRPILKNPTTDASASASSARAASASRSLPRTRSAPSVAPSGSPARKRRSQADLALADLEELRSDRSRPRSSAAGEKRGPGLAEILRPVALASAGSRAHRRRPKRDEDVFLAVLKSAYHEFEHLFIHNHSYYTPEELDHRRLRRGETRDYNEIAARMARPLGFFLLHLTMCYDFPFSGRWMLMLAIDALLLAVWKHYDADWMLDEIGHWDYLVGAALLAMAGVISVIHQVVSLITDIFFLIAPVALTLLYLGLLMYGRLNREVY